MKEEPRFLIGNYLFRIDPFFRNISQVGNADNHISIDKLIQNKHSYNLHIDQLSGKLHFDEQGNNIIQVTIPKSVLDDGYAECSKYAENFNTKLSEKFGIRLVDEAVWKEMEHMVIPLPEHVFPFVEKDGFKFEIDVSLRELRNVDKPFVHIDLDRLDQIDGKYIVHVCEDGGLSEWYHENTTKLEIDQLVKIAPDDVSKVYGIPKESLPETDHALRSNPEFIRDRIEKGKLPVIRIVDEDYYVDTRLQELRACNKFWKTLELIDNGPTAFEVDRKHVYLYDYLNRQVIKNFNELTEIPRHTAFIVLPDFVSLDPVAAGRSICKDPYAFLEKYPLQPRMEARLVPIEKTYLAEQIRRNQEMKLAEGKSNKKAVNNRIIKPKKNNNKNNGLHF